MAVSGRILWGRGRNRYLPHPHLLLGPGRRGVQGPHRGISVRGKKAKVTVNQGRVWELSRGFPEAEVTDATSSRGAKENLAGTRWAEARGAVQGKHRLAMPHTPCPPEPCDTMAPRKRGGQQQIFFREPTIHTGWKGCRSCHRWPGLTGQGPWDSCVGSRGH